MATLNKSILVSVRQVLSGEEKLMLEFWEKLNGDMSMHDHNAYFSLDPSYLLAAVDGEGTAVGFGAVSKHTEDTVYLGNFIVRRDLVNHGIGRQLWKAMTEKAQNKNIALDAISYMVGWYEKQGFKYHGFKVEFHNVTILTQMKKKPEFPLKYQVKSLKEDFWPVLLKYDCLVYPCLDREPILRAWFCMPEVRVVLAFEGDKVVGYGSIHKKPTGQQFGLRNVFGDSEHVIEAILRELFADVPVGQVVRFMKVDGKPLPKYISHADGPFDSALRMYNKFLIETNTEKMWLASAHIL